MILFYVPRFRLLFFEQRMVPWLCDAFPMNTSSSRHPECRRIAGQFFCLFVDFFIEHPEQNSKAQTRPSWHWQLAELNVQVRAQESMPKMVYRSPFLGGWTVDCIDRLKNRLSLIDQKIMYLEYTVSPVMSDPLSLLGTSFLRRSSA